MHLVDKASILFRLKMTIRANISSTPVAHGLGAVTGWFICAVLSLALVFAQSMPMSASVSGDGTWIEICGGEDGSYFIQQDDGTPQHTPMECVHCDGCLMVSNISNAHEPSDWFLSVPLGASHVIFSPAQTTGLAGAEQYWAACRGPPLQNTGNRMPSIPILASIPHAPAPSDTWRNS